MTLGVNMGIILVVGLVLHWFTIGWYTLLFPFLLVELYVLVLGIGLLFSALFTFYRDLGHIWEILLQLLFFGSAIVYPATIVPERYIHLLFLCPTTQIVEDLRRSIVTTRIPWSVHISGFLEIFPFGSVVVVFAIGALVFHRLTPRFGEAL
jgi:ABC-2 type transport system permease protein